MRRRVKNITHDKDDDEYDYDDYEDSLDEDDDEARAYLVSSAPVKPKKAAAVVKAPLTPKSTPPKAKSPAIPAAKRVDKGKPSYEEEIKNISKNREILSLVVIGHVDAGKSTMTGHLLYECSAITTQQLRRLESEAKQAGKSSFFYAWIMDEGSDERERGVTVDVAFKTFETEHKIVNLIDGPGHRDFIPAMILGVMHADAALLVVDAADHLKPNRTPGQEKEHLLLIRSLGISRLIIAINKMDLLSWDEKSYENVKSKISIFIESHCLAFQQLYFTPVDAFEGKNLTSQCEEVSTWTGDPIKPLLQLIDELPTLQAPSSQEKPTLAAYVSDVLTCGQPTTVSLKVDSGYLAIGEQVTVLPSGIRGKVSSLQCRGKARGVCGRGEYVEAAVVQVDSSQIWSGSVLVSDQKSITVSRIITAKVLIFDVPIPLCQGIQCMVYLHTSVQPAKLIDLQSILDKSSGKVKQQRPRVLVKGQMAIIKLELMNTIAFKPMTTTPSFLCRLLIRMQNQTVAAGVAI